MKPTISGFFRSRFVQAILLSGLFLQIGIWVRNYTILLFVMEQTHGDPLAVSMISVAEYAPIFVFSFIGGTFADRWRPKRTMVWCDLLSALSVFAVLLTLVFGTWKAVFFATFVSSILSQFSQPSGMKLFKVHVPEEQLQFGMSIYQTMGAFFMILGPLMGTFVYQNFGIDYGIGIMGIAFALSALALTFLPPDRKTETDQPATTLTQEMVLGCKYVLSRKSLRLLGGSFAAAGLGLGLIQPLGIFLVTDRLGLPKEDLQWVMTAFGAAMILGGALSMGYSKKISPQKLLALGMIANVAGIILSGLSTVFWLTLAAQAVSGLFMPCIQIGINTMILQNSEEAFVGRVNGILNPLFMGAMVVTMTLAGGLVRLFSLVSVYMVSAAIFFAGILFLVPLFGRPVDRRNGQSDVQSLESQDGHPNSKPEAEPVSM